MGFIGQGFRHAHNLLKGGHYVASGVESAFREGRGFSGAAARAGVRAGQVGAAFGGNNLAIGAGVIGGTAVAGMVGGSMVGLPMGDIGTGAAAIGGMAAMRRYGGRGMSIGRMTGAMAAVGAGYGAGQVGVNSTLAGGVAAVGLGVFGKGARAGMFRGVRAVGQMLGGGKRNYAAHHPGMKGSVGLMNKSYARGARAVGATVTNSATGQGGMMRGIAGIAAAAGIANYASTGNAFGNTPLRQGFSFGGGGNYGGMGSMYQQGYGSSRSQFMM